MSALSPNVRRFVSTARRLQRCCSRVEAQVQQGRLRITDAELVYASGFLTVVARWEAFLELCLVDTVCGPARPSLRKRRLVQIGSKAQLRRLLLFPDHEYISLPTVKIAKQTYELFVRDGLPFSSISEANQSYIQQAMWIRNAIAHASAYAYKTFRDKVPGVAALPSNRRRPGAFLRHEFRVSPTQRRFDLYCAALLTAAHEMDESWAE